MWRLSSGGATGEKTMSEVEPTPAQSGVGGCAQCGSVVLEVTEHPTSMFCSDACSAAHDAENPGYWTRVEELIPAQLEELEGILGRCAKC